MKQFHSEQRMVSNWSNFFSLRSLLIVAVFFLNTEIGRGQVSITTAGSAYTENFNSIGTSATATLPSGFVFLNGGNTFASGYTATTLAYGSSGTGVVTGTSGGGRINWANGVTGSSTDRAIGFLNTGSFTTPDTICFAFTNNTGSSVTSIELSWNYEKIRSGTRQFDWTFYHASSLSSMTSFTSGDLSSPADANNTTIYNPPTQTLKSISVTGLSISSGTTYYLKWVLTGLAGSSNAQGFGIDDFSITLNAGAAAPTITTPTSANITSSSADLGGNVTSDGGSAVTERGVVWSATATNNDPLIGGTGVTKVTGTGTTGVFTVNATSLPFASGISYKAYATNSIGTSYTSVSTFNTLGATPPTLTAASGATVDASFDVTFTDDASWRAAITTVKYGFNTLVLNTDYTISAGTITLIPSGSGASGLRTAGSQTVTVVATGYNDATVNQSIAAGAANKLGMSTQPVGPAANGGALATQPVVLIQDQYGNATTSTASVTAAVGAGAWTIGGTTTVAATAGTATFSGLTATCANSITGATISFTSSGLTGVSSNAFNITGPIIAKWTFEGVTVTGTSTTSPTLSSVVASSGSNTTGSVCSALHASASTWSAPSGNGSATCLSVNTWAIGDYFQFKFSTTGFNGLRITWDQTGSTTGPKDFKVQYSNDGSVFTDASGTNSTYALTADGWSTGTYQSASTRILDLSGVTALNNQPFVYIRLVCTSTTGISATFGSGGTDRVDNFTVTGCSIPTVSAQPGTTQSVCKDGTPANLSVTGAGYGLSYQWYSNTSNSNSGGTDLGTGSGAQTDTYTPSTGTVGTLYYYCVITGACGAVTSNTSEVIVNDIASANAGSNQGVCGPTTATLNGSIGGSATSATWSTTGSGSFSPNANTLNATYNATTAELRAGAALVFTLTPNNPAGCGFSTSTTNIAFCANASLPVSFTSFSGKKVGSQNLLKWTTANEQNNTGFEVMRSADGIHYSDIGFVRTLAINGNSSELLYYSFIDNSAAGDRQYYQLRQIDLDGRSKTSSVVLIRESNSGSFTIDQLMPNPARDKVNAIILSPGKDKLHMMITDLSGKTIRQQYNFVEAGANTIEMQTGGLASGTYLVQVISITTGQRSFSKLIKQ